MITKREAKLLDVIDYLIARVEIAACTCPDTDTYNRLHEAGGRRRKDSKCTGVVFAVTADLARRRAMRLRG